MTGLRNVFAAGMTIAVLGIGVGCGSGGDPDPNVIGRRDRYDYSPSVIQTGDVRQYWWCGQAVNPNNSKQDSDTIQYQSVNQTTNATVGPMTVLGESPGTWDNWFLCNPKVIGGVFTDPLGDGMTYQYAMYYVATADGVTNNIGVAFSNDGIAWKKYPNPVLRTSATSGYGIGQPAAYNSDGKAAITVFYEDWNPTVHHVAATSTDGVHFTVQGALTTVGLDPDIPKTAWWGDMAYDPTSGYWYAAFQTPLRDPSTTGGITELGSYGIELYRIRGDALLTGTTPWQELHSFDTNMTGFEANHLAGFVRDMNGNVYVGPTPAIQMYITVSNPRPPWDASPASAGGSGFVDRWDLAPVQWVPNTPLMPLNRYYNGTSHVVTTGWISPSGGFQLQSTLGHIYESQQQGATVPFYGCKRGSKDYFVSLDNACEGQRILGKNGYGYSQPVDGLNLVALYRCKTKQDHFVSADPKCEGQTTDELLGYVLP
jgi:hypothetical protein